MARRLTVEVFEEFFPAEAQRAINHFLATKEIRPDDIYLIKQSSAATTQNGGLKTVLHVTIWYYEKV